MEDNIGAKEGMTIKKETIKEGKVEKTTFFFPDLDVSVNASSQEEARKLALEQKRGTKAE